MKKNRKNTRIKEPAIDGVVIAVILCLFIPFMYFKNTLDPVLYPRLTAWAGATILFGSMGFVFYRKSKKLEIPIKHPLILILFGYLLWSFMALIWTGNPVEGFTDVFKWLIFPMFVLLLFVFLSRNSRTFDIILRGVVVYSLFTAIYGIMQFFEVVPRQSDVNAVYDVKGLMAHKNQLSIALFLFIPFLYYAWSRFTNGWRKAALFAFIADVLLILLLGTRAVWLALIFCSFCFALFYVWMQKSSEKEKAIRWIKRFIYIGGTILIGLILSYWFLPEEFLLNRITSRFATIMDPEFTSNKWRTEMWQATFNLFKDHPLFGVGSGNWKIEIYPYYSEFQPSVFRHWRNPHNDFLLVATEKGIVGLGFFILIYLFPSVLAYKLAKHAKSRTEKFSMMVFSVFLLGYLFVSLFSFPGERIHHHVFLGLVISFLLVQQSNAKKQFLVSIPKGLFIWVPLVMLLPVFIFGVRTVKAEINLKKAFALQDAEQWRDMIRYVDKANFRWAPLEPRRSCPIEFYRGFAKYKMKAYPEAKNIFLRTYRLHPYNQMITNNLGSVYGQLSTFDSAAFFFNRSIDLLPRYELGLINLSKVYYFTEDNEKAYQTILACDPQSDNQEINQISSALKKRINKIQN